MRFPNVNVKRKIGMQSCFYSIKYKFLIIDPGYEEGDIYLYELKERRNSGDLRVILEEYLNGDELDNPKVIEIKEFKEKNIKFKVLKV